MKIEETKLCTGLGHDTPTRLPATDKYFYRYGPGKRKGKLMPRCKLCCNWHRRKNPGGLHGTVTRNVALPYVIEGVNRLGHMEFARRTGVSQNTLREILTGYSWNGRIRQRVLKTTLRRMMVVLVNIREHDEVRHRDSIHHGTTVRGKAEKKVSEHKHLYKPHGDNDTQFKRKKRRATAGE